MFSWHFFPGPIESRDSNGANMDTHEKMSTPDQVAGCFLPEGLEEQGSSPTFAFFVNALQFFSVGIGR